MQRRIRQRRGQAGFTLVELLVVIVILGILAAVVVFAVRGAGDKGKDAAVQTDKRTIRTALEVFCGRNDRYPGGPAAPEERFKTDPMLELVEGNYLSNTSEYHRLTTGDGDFPPQGFGPEGKCTNTPMKYKLEGPQNGSSRTGTCLDPPATWRPNLFCETGSRTEGSTNYNLRSPLQLPDGRVMAILNRSGFAGECGSLRIELYAPNTGKWTTGPQGQCSDHTTGDFTGGHVNMALISDAAGPCAPVGAPSNCGKVLIYTDNSRGYNWERWYLYDPTVPNGTVATALKEITPINPRTGGRTSPTTGSALSLLQVAGPGCSVHCGEILIAGSHFSIPFPGIDRPPMYRIFDPTNSDPSKAFRTVSRPPEPNEIYTPILVGLADGKILASGTKYNFPEKRFQAIAEVIDPSDPSGPSVQPIMASSHVHDTSLNRVTGIRLATNEVLLTGLPPQGAGDTADIFDPGKTVEAIRSREGTIRALGMSVS